ncbi:MAG: alpha-glucan family phosphorylase [Anaerolineae bacterium]
MLRPFHTFTVVPSLPSRLSPLRELAYNLWWTWNLDAVDLFRRLDRDLWEETGHNPVRMLGMIRQDRLQEVALDDGFLSHMMRVYQALNRYMGARDTWYRKRYEPNHGNLRIVYFSAEFGITESMPIYSGGLGVLAGDTLKSASDLGLPLVGMGLLYQNGYFQQYLNADGWQQESYPVNDFHNMPLEMEQAADGKPLTIQVEYPGRVVEAQIWRAQVGRVPLYFLDTNLSSNRPEDRAITSQLYGGDLDMRIRQEIMLGIGGLRALDALGIQPTVCHMNEGHSAFMALERIRKAMKDDGLSFAEASTATSAGNVFTTHTPVPAGIDWFPTQLMDTYFTGFREQLGIGRDEFLNLGRPIVHGPEDSFSMAILALRLAAKTNGVSRLHGEVARAMWRDLWPQTPIQEVPITSITNGIHTRSWISNDLSGLLIRYLGPRWIEQPADHSVWRHVDRIPDEELWRTHERRRERLVSVARDRLRQQLAQHGASPQEIAQASEVLHPDALTIGFARRFATYKRALLLFSDPERLSRILNATGRPVQVIFAGKAHPHDNPGKEFIRQLVHYARQADLRHHIIFLENYDTSLARYLVQGVDVWLNTPRRGLEASGTSGMKAAANGGINLSTLDGWWVEGYSPETGWRVGQGESYDDEHYGDQVEAEALYDLLEKSIVPMFYDRGADDLPRAWIAMMKRSMEQIAPVFNTHRMVQEYTEQLYLPSDVRYGRLRAEEYRDAKDLASWLDKVRSHWGEVKILSVDGDDQSGLPVGTDIRVHAKVALGALQPEDVRVQVYHGRVGPRGQLHEEHTVDMAVETKDGDGNQIWSGTFRSEKSGLYGYTVRILPSHETLLEGPVPGLVVWSS